MRFTLSKLFLAVALAGLACAGMVNRTELWAGAILTLTLLLYFLIAACAIGLRRGQQASAIAFAGVGIMYLMFALFAGSMARGSLLTNYPMAVATKTMQIPIEPRSTGSSGASGSSGRVRPAQQEMTVDAIIELAFTDYQATTQVRRFFLIGHCVSSWLLALVASAVAGYIYAKKSSSEGN